VSLGNLGLRWLVTRTKWRGDSPLYPTPQPPASTQLASRLVPSTASARRAGSTCGGRGAGGWGGGGGGPLRRCGGHGLGRDHQEASPPHTSRPMSSACTQTNTARARARAVWVMAWRLNVDRASDQPSRMAITGGACSNCPPDTRRCGRAIGPSGGLPTGRVSRNSICRCSTWLALSRIAYRYPSASSSS